MLVLCRKVGERVVIGDVEVVVLRVSATRVRIGIVAPKDSKIRRGELPSRPAEEEPPQAA